MCANAPVLYYIWQSSCFAYLPSNTHWHYHPGIQLYLSIEGDIALELEPEHATSAQQQEVQPCRVVASAVAVPSHMRRRVKQQGQILQFTYSPYRMDTQHIYRLNALQAVTLTDSAIAAAKTFLQCKNGINALRLRTELQSAVLAISEQQAMDRRVQSVFLGISENYEQRLNLIELSAKTGLSESRLQHLFKAQIGTSMSRYQQWLRLRMSFQLIAQGAKPIEAAHQAGFTDQAHFSRLFKRSFGYAPSDLLKKYGEAKIVLMEAMTY